MKLPLISWCNGICETNRLACRFFLTERASWGYVVAAEGPPGGYPGNRTMFSTVAESRAAINWAMDGGGRKYEIDGEKVATAGHCGGLEASLGRRLWIIWSGSLGAMWWRRGGVWILGFQGA